MKSVKDIPVDKLLGIKVIDADGNLSTIKFVGEQRNVVARGGVRVTYAPKTIVVLSYNDNTAAALHHHEMTDFYYTE